MKIIEAVVTMTNNGVAHTVQMANSKLLKVTDTNSSMPALYKNDLVMALETSKGAILLEKMVGVRNHQPKINFQAIKHKSELRLKNHKTIIMSLSKISGINLQTKNNISLSLCPSIKTKLKANRIYLQSHAYDMNLSAKSTDAITVKEENNDD